MTTFIASTINNVGGDQYNIFHLHQNTIAGPSSSSATAPPISFNDTPLGFLSAHFTGRQDELAHITRLLDVVHGDIPTSCVVYGDHGVGKTQLTFMLTKMAFAQGRYTCIFWIPATTIEKLHQGLSRLLHLVAHPERSNPDGDVRLTAARRWLESFVSGRWLLVFDNVARDTVDFLREHLPRKNNRGNILFTTRTGSVAAALAHALGEHHDILELRILDEEAAVRLLLGHFEDSEIDANSSQLQEIVNLLGCLPLAIAQIAAYVRQTKSTFDNLLAILRSDARIDMINWENDLSIYQEKSIAATFDCQLTDLKQQAPDASSLLNVLVFFDPENIPLDMLVTGADILSNSRLQPSPVSISIPPENRLSLVRKFKKKLFPTPTYKGKGKGQADEASSSLTDSSEESSLLAMIRSPISLYNAIAQLQNRALMNQQRSGQSTSLRIHDLIQLIVLDHTKKLRVEQKWFEFAVELAYNAFSKVDDPELPEYWPQCEILIPHIQSLTTREELSRNGKKSLLSMNHRIAIYMRSHGRYEEAERLLERVLRVKEHILGPSHLDALTTMHELAWNHSLRGRYDDAETLFKQVLSSREKQLGPEHINMLTTKHNLALVYDSQGRYSDAETLFKQVLSSEEKQLGPEHVNTLTTKHNLALVYDSQGRYSDAETLFKQVLSSEEKQLGPEHVSTLTTKNNLALVYNSQGRYSDAETLFKQVRSSREKQLGSEHVSTLTTKHNLALIYDSQGRYSDAETLFKQVLSSEEKQLGPEHVNTLTTKHNLARVYKSQGRYSDAETLFKQVLSSEEKQLGPEHVSTLTTKHNLAHVYDSQGRYSDAETLFEQVLSNREKRLGSSHPDTQSTRNCLADLYTKQGRFDDAERINQDVPYSL